MPTGTALRCRGTTADRSVTCRGIEQHRLDVPGVFRPDAAADSPRPAGRRTLRGRHRGNLAGPAAAHLPALGLLAEGQSGHGPQVGPVEPLLACPAPRRRSTESCWSVSPSALAKCPNSRPTSRGPPRSGNPAAAAQDRSFRGGLRQARRTSEGARWRVPHLPSG